MEITHISLLGFTIFEPVTTLTDLMLSALSFYSYKKLGNEPNSEKPYVFFRYYFLVLSLATLVSGVIGHALIPYLDFSWKLPGWIINILSLALLERATIHLSDSVIKPILFETFKVTNIVVLLAALVLTTLEMDYFIVGLYTLYVVGIVLIPVYLILFVKTRSRSSKYALYALGFSVLSVIVFAAKISLGVWFNHLDVSHIFILAAVWCFFLVAREYPNEVQLAYSS